MIDKLMHIVYGLLGGLLAYLMCSMIFMPKQIVTIDMVTLVKKQLTTIAKAKGAQKDKINAIRNFDKHFKIILNKYSNKHHLIILNKPAVANTETIPDVTKNIQSLLKKGVKE